VNGWRLGVPLVALLLACGNPPTETGDDIDQTYLFEVEYVNFAWGLAWRGLVIDREGNVNAYDHGHEVWSHAANDSHTEADLATKYAHGARYVGRIDEATVAQQFGKISRIADQLSAPEHPCADAGAFTYRTFIYESETSRYRPLLLRQEGDVVLENTSSVAQELAGWLRNLVSALDAAGVEPFDEGVCTP
jgi:hypothetical protein